MNLGLFFAIVITVEAILGALSIIFQFRGKIGDIFNFMLFGWIALAIVILAWSIPFHFLYY